jgi:hypothetical protein
MLKSWADDATVNLFFLPLQQNQKFAKHQVTVSKTEMGRRFVNR